MSMSNTPSIHQKIKLIREALGFTQENFIAHLGDFMSDSSLSKMENGGEVSYELVLRIVNMYKNSEYYLFDWSNDFPDLSQQWASVDEVNAIIANLDMGDRLKWVSIRCGISAKAMGLVFGCSEGMVNRYWASETMPCFDYIKAFLSVDKYRKYDAFLLGIADKMPGEADDAVSLHLRRAAKWLKRNEGIELDQLHDYLNAGKGDLLDKKSMKKVLAGVEPLPAQIIRNLATTQGHKQLALYIIGMDEMPEDILGLQ